MTFCSQIFSWEKFSIKCVQKIYLFLFFQTGMCLEFPFQLSCREQVNLFHSQYSLQSIIFKDQVGKSIVIAVPYISIFTVINWPKQHRFLSVPYHFRVCVLTAQQLHVITIKYAIIIMFRHPIHEDYNQITELPGMVDGLHWNSNDQLYNSTLNLKA